MNLEKVGQIFVDALRINMKILRVYFKRGILYVSNSVFCISMLKTP